MEQAYILPSGDRALVVEFGKTIDEALNGKVQALAQSLRDKPICGVTECVPTYRSLLVCFDPARVRYETLSRRLITRCASLSAAPAAQGRVLTLPCLYDGEDLPDMAQLTGLSTEEIIRIHSNRSYLVYMLGFLPGFVYLGGLDKLLSVPRLTTPRTVIPAGSVGIGGNQTGVYPMVSPGGWRLIGRTPVPLYDPKRDEPILFHAGDRVRFKPIDRERFDVIAAQVAQGVWSPEAYIEGGVLP